MGPIIAANWKMNLVKDQVVDWIDKINQSQALEQDVSLIVCPAHCYLTMLQGSLTWGHIGCQHVSEHSEGAYTGGHSAAMVKSCGAEYAIVGHSERRHIFGETNADIKAQLRQCHDAGLTPILCVGETIEQRQSGQFESVIVDQLSVLSSQPNPIIIAYEPVWAIGTGETATPEQANDAHAFIKQHVDNKSPVLYGGSVNASNCEGLLSMPSIDGALVGGASLKPDVFSDIMRISSTLIEA
ncbi:MAG: triose-phosphate isomerase [Candidatus Margulisbacteria bacterium]|nr:triose-phosphate isomerase [Candidatus Margulisiibacteriota bacterium]